MVRKFYNLIFSDAKSKISESRRTSAGGQVDKDVFTMDESVLKSFSDKKTVSYPASSSGK